MKKYKAVKELAVGFRANRQSPNEGRRDAEPLSVAWKDIAIARKAVPGKPFCTFKNGPSKWTEKKCPICGSDFMGKAHRITCGLVCRMKYIRKKVGKKA